MLKFFDVLNAYLDHFKAEVAPLYEDDMKDDVFVGLHNAIVDSISEESPYKDGHGNFRTWEDVLGDETNE